MSRAGDREHLRDGDLVKDAQTGRLWSVEDTGRRGSVKVRGVGKNDARPVWIPRHKLTVVQRAEVSP